MVRRRILPALLACTALVLGLGVGLAPPAQADPAPTIAATMSTVWPHPGETMTVTVTFTNPETVPVTFAYASINPIYRSWVNGRQYALTGCTGEMASCWFSNPSPPMAAMMHPVYPTGAPLAPGASRTQTITLQVEPTAPCGAEIGFFLYSYRESSAGNIVEMQDGPDAFVQC